MPRSEAGSAHLQEEEREISRWNGVEEGRFVVLEDRKGFGDSGRLVSVWGLLGGAADRVREEEEEVGEKIMLI